MSREAARVPGEAGIWVLVGGDLLAFSVFFVTFAVHRGADPALYARSQALLHRSVGTANTLLLLTGSWLVASAVERARADQREGLWRWIAGAAGTGALFLVAKASEWASLFAGGVSVDTSEYFVFYFMYGGIHALHVVLGLGVLVHLAARASRGARAGDPPLAALEAGAIFWHLVDVLWIVLFATLYLANWS